jgi:hypothetical protein
MPVAGFYQEQIQDGEIWPLLTGGLGGVQEQLDAAAIVVDARAMKQDG